jgi:AcrR family transcriptional regulator
MDAIENKKKIQKGTKTTILDAAENLFAENGFKRTTIKLIAKNAGVNIAAVNYHFGSKSSLIETVIKRRFVPINEKRLQKLISIKTTSEQKLIKPSINEVLYAFIDPLFSTYNIENKKKCFISIACQIFLEQDEAILKIFMLLFKEPFLLLYQLLEESLPNIPEEVLSWRVHYAIGAMIYCMRIYSTRFPVLEIAPKPINSISHIVNSLINFIVGGLKSPVEV